MDKHTDVNTYWAAIAPELRRHIDGHRLPEVENTLMHGLALFSFAQEGMSSSISKNHECFRNTSIMLVLMQDILRGLWAAQTELSPVATAALFRTAFELRCNFLFISTHTDPQKFASRYARYRHIERILHEEHRPAPGESILSENEERQIRRLCPEWFGPNGQGRVRVAHWTAEKDLKSLKTLAQQVGLQTQYHMMYSLGSKFIHGSSLLENIYSGHGGIGAVANLTTCSEMSLLAIDSCMDFLSDVQSFYGLPRLETEHERWRRTWLAAQNSLSNKTPYQGK